MDYKERKKYLEYLLEKGCTKQQANRILGKVQFSSVNNYRNLIEQNLQKLNTS